MKLLVLVLLVLHRSAIPALLFCLATDTITPYQKVPDGKTIVSAGEVFELGFFSPNGTDARYVGIWWKGFPDVKFVWVANRETPLMDTSGILMIGNDGNLIIVNGRNNTIWSTKVAAGANKTTATLSNTGNLVLHLNGSVLWESFKHPSDTFLAGMKIGMNLKTGEQIYLTSWEDEKDPFPGRYTFEVDPQELPETVVRQGTATYWRSGQWNGRSFVGIPRMTKDYRTGYDFAVDSNRGSYYFTYAVSNDSIPKFLYLDTSGFAVEVKWDAEKQQWVRTARSPDISCGLFNKCGTFGQCNSADSPICNCVMGYEPKSIQQWGRGNWSDGCVRRAKFQCETSTGSVGAGGDWFLKLTSVRLPYNSHYIYASNATDCEGSCLSNCSCIAYAYVDGIGCMIWDNDLVDLEMFPNGGEELHIRLAHSELGGKTKVRLYVVILIVTSAALSLVVITFFLYRRARYTGCKNVFRRILVSCKRKLKSEDYSARNQLHFNKFNQGESPGISFFSFEYIEAVTNNFSASSMIGEGGFGTVYKGRLSDGSQIAVKRLSRSSGQGLEEFKNEVVLISKLQHRNLVRLLGYSVHKEEKVLIYEYMPNKSLDDFIFGSGSEENAMLNWSQRSHIVEGIARGLLYLHHDSRLKIIHRDLKASNVLLDEELKPRISDFGMARIVGVNQISAKTERVVGTYGYMSPEYAMQGIFSEKSDVFSFGVLVLETVSSKKNTRFGDSPGSSSLLDYAWELWNEGKAVELMDPRLANSCIEMEVQRCINIGLLCVQECAGDRPTMAEVVSMLCNDTILLPSPKRPAFCLVQPIPDKLAAWSRNSISDKTIEGR